MASELATGSVTQVAWISATPPAAMERRAGDPPAAEAESAKVEGVAEALRDAMAGLSELVQSQRRSLQFSVDATSGRTVIRVLDAETQELIRQIPAEEVVNLSRWLRGMSGALLDANA